MRRTVGSGSVVVLGCALGLVATPAVLVGQDRVDDAFAWHPRRVAWISHVQVLNRGDFSGAPAFAKLDPKEVCSRLVRACYATSRRRGAPELAAASRLPSVTLIPALGLSGAPGATGPLGKASQQADVLPAYDDAGFPITRGEIEARMRSGAGVLGGVLGSVLGLLVGAVAAPDCPFEIFGPPCSPREDALVPVAILSGLAWGAAVGAIIGSEAGIDRWDALKQIRAERRAAANRGQ